MVGGDVVVAAVVVVVVAGVVDCGVVSLCLLAIHWSQLTVVEPGNSISSSRELSPPVESQLERFDKKKLIDIWLKHTTCTPVLMTSFVGSPTH